MSEDLRGVYILTYGRWGEAHEVDGKTAVFSTREKAIAFRKAARAKSYWLMRVTYCGGNPTPTVDPTVPPPVCQFCGSFDVAEDYDDAVGGQMSAHHRRPLARVPYLRAADRHPPLGGVVREGARVSQDESRKPACGSRRKPACE
jgi:hypothetical protein